MPFPDATPLIVAVAILACFGGGMAKGVAGLGLQTVTIPLVGLVAPLEMAIGFSIRPTFVTSLWQGLAGGVLRKVVGSTWTFLLPRCLGIFLGARLLAQVDRPLLTGYMSRSGRSKVPGLRGLFSHDLETVAFAAALVQRSCLPLAGGGASWPMMNTLTYSAKA